jgi:hypothetical protein
MPDPNIVMLEHGRGKRFIIISEAEIFSFNFERMSF